MKKELATFMTAWEFDDLVKKTYNQKFEFCADKETPNDTAYVFRVERKPWKQENACDDYEIRYLDEFKATGKGSYLSHILLQDMVSNGTLEAGIFVIEVSW